MKHLLSVPEWSEDDEGPNVLVEATDPSKRDAIARILTQNCYSVRTCEGPAASGEQCVLVDVGECSAVADADVIVHAMRYSDERNREVLHDIQRRHPEVPIVVEVPAPVVAQHPEDFENCRVLPQPMTSSTLLRAVDEALAS